MLRPTLIIALGGTGTNTVLRLRERFLLRFGTRDPDGVRFLFVDTDINNNPALRRYQARSIALTVGASRLMDCQDPASPTSLELRLEEWFDPDLRRELTNQNFQSGVRGVRTYGRFSLLAADRRSDLIEQLETDIQALRRNREGADPGALNIFVVSSAGGGTGSGIFLDIGYMTRWILGTRLNIAADLCQREGIAAVAVPSLVSAPQQARNSAALLTELDHFSDANNTFAAVYAGTPLPADLGREAPYDYITLVSPTQNDQILDDDPREAIRNLEQKIADYLFVRLIGPGEIGARLHDMRQNWVVQPKDNRGYPNRFLTCGIGLRQFPIGLIGGIGYRYAVSNFVDGWLKGEQDEEEYLADAELENSPTFKQSYEADLGALRRMMGLPAVHLHRSKEARDCEQDELYKDLIQTSQEPLESALRSRTRSGKVDELFQYEGAGQPISPGQPGYIAGTVRRNTESQLNRHVEQSLVNRVRDHLWTSAFDRERGPRYALRLLRDITREMQQDEEFMGQVLKDAGAAGGGDVGGSRRAQHVRNDTLLLLWRDIAADRELGRLSSDAAAYANHRYETCFVDAKKSIYNSLRTQLLNGGDDLDVRLRRLVEYIEGWKAQAEKDALEQDQLLENLPPGTIYPKDLVNKKLQRLTPTVNPENLDALRQMVRAEEFGIAIPRTDEGRIDFAPFAAVMRRIHESLHSTSGGAASSIYGESVVRLITEERKGNIQAECENVVNESRPLLNLRLDAVGYGELLDSRPPAFPQPTYLWYFVAHPRIDADAYSAFWHCVEDAAQGIAGSVKASQSPIQSLASEDGSVAAALFIRGAFPTRVLNQYDANDRRSLLYPPSSVRITTAFTQTGITLPLTEDEIRRAQMLLVLGEALRVLPKDTISAPAITWLGEEHEYRYSLNPHEGAKLTWRKDDFERAAYLLAVNDNARDALWRELILRARDPNQQGLIAQRIADHIKGLNSRVVNGRRDGYYDGLDLDKLDFPKSIALLKTGAQELGISLDARRDPGLHPWAAFDESMQVWRCKNEQCRNSLGEAEPGPNGECPRCRYPNVLQ